MYELGSLLSCCVRAPRAAWARHPLYAPPYSEHHADSHAYLTEIRSSLVTIMAFLIHTLLQSKRSNNIVS
jgi:hypothetical protein